MNKENDMTYLTNREAALHLCNGGKLEICLRDEWHPGTGGNILLYPESIDCPSPYRAAVETFQITVRGVTFDVPEPVREPLESDTRYWVPDIKDDDWAHAVYWCDDILDAIWLERGLIHLTEAAAVTHARAMCGVK